MNTLKRRANRRGIRQWPGGVIAESAREALVAWAEHHDVQASGSKHPCLHWLAVDRCPELIRNHHLRGISVPCPTLDMFDHQLAWIRNGRPLVITAANYSPVVELHDRIGPHAEGLGLRVDCEQPGWYGHGTTHIEVWAPSPRPGA